MSDNYTVDDDGVFLVSQEIYDKIKDGITEISKGSPCMSKSGSCLYRKPKGAPDHMNSACIAGHFLEDDFFGNDPYVVGSLGVLNVREKDIGGIPLVLMAKLQEAHDSGTGPLLRRINAKPSPSELEILLENHWKKLWDTFYSHVRVKPEKPEDNSVKGNRWPDYRFDGYGNNQMKHTKGVRREIARFYLNNIVTYRYLGKIFHVAPSTVWRYVQNHRASDEGNITTIGEYSPEFRMAAVMKALDVGVRLSADIFGCSQGSIRNWMKTYNMADTYHNSKLSKERRSMDV